MEHWGAIVVNFSLVERMEIINELFYGVLKSKIQRVRLSRSLLCSSLALMIPNKLLPPLVADNVEMGAETLLSLFKSFDQFLSFPGRT